MRVRFGRTQLGYAWAIVEPLAYVGLFSLMFHFMDRHPPFGRSMTLFFATGILPFLLFRNVVNQLTGAFKANQALLTYPIVQPIDTIISRTILEVATAFFVMSIVFSMLMYFEQVSAPVNIMRMFESITLLTLIGVGYGLMSAVITTRLESWANISRLIMMPLMFLSGVFTPIDSLPAKVRNVVSWNPIIHGVEMFRDGYYSNFRSDQIDSAYLAVCGLMFLFLGIVMDRTVRAHIE
jgi:capsular polysaccharide transport system permease protein